MKNKILFLLFLTLTKNVSAVCLVCTLGAGATFGFARAVGISDLVTGIFFGGLLFSSSKWLGDILGKKFHNILLYVFSFLINYSSLYFLYGKFIHYKEYLFLGFDKFLFGIFTGSIISIASYMSYLFLKKHNNNKAYFPYQKVVMYIASLLLTGGMFHFIEKYFVV